MTVAVVGLGFGAEFVPIYAAHPDVDRVIGCDRDPALVASARLQGADAAYRDLDRVLADPTIDAVHLATGILDHARHTVAALEAGRHVACAVPMGQSLAELESIIEACARTGRRYMMMETAVYTREFWFVRHLRDAGWLGAISYARGTHFQDMTGWPDYWRGLPPLHYTTHAIAPLLALLDTQAATVRGLGAGVLAVSERGLSGNPYAVETANLTLVDRDAVLDVTRSMSHVARPYLESFSVYGELRSFEWQRLEHDRPYLFRMESPTGGRGRPITTERPTPPPRPDLLPRELAGFADGAHGGSHPHLVHEFVRSLIEDRPPAIDEYRAAQWTAPGLVGHTSALAGGAVLDVPRFDR